MIYIFTLWDFYLHIIICDIFYGVYFSANVCICVYICFFVLFLLAHFSVCLDFSFLFYFVLDNYLFFNEREKELVWFWWVERWEGSGRSWGRGNHN